MPGGLVATDPEPVTPLLLAPGLADELELLEPPEPVVGLPLGLPLGLLLGLPDPIVELPGAWFRTMLVAWSQH